MCIRDRPHAEEGPRGAEGAVRGVPVWRRRVRPARLRAREALIALENHLPRVRVPWVPIGRWPTPLTALEIEGRPVWVKHEGDAHPGYGGNKVRTLEVWFGPAQAAGAR